MAAKKYSDDLKKENHLIRRKMVNNQKCVVEERAKYKKHFNEVEEKVHFVRVQEV